MNAPGRAGQTFPKIELDSNNYELLRLIMTTDGAARPGSVAWNDILGIFRAIGFGINTSSGRASRGAIQLFTPSPALRQSQVSQMKRIGSVESSVSMLGAPQVSRNYQYALGGTKLSVITGLKLTDVSIGHRSTNFKRSAS